MEQILTLKPFDGFVDSRIGGRVENQDSCGFVDTKLGLLVTVCDGMGGGPGGKTASAISVAEIIKGVMESDESETAPNILIKAIRRANMAVIQRGDDEPDLKGMGSTATVLLINSQSVVLAHVGDSRIYQLRDGKIIFRTFDHSMVFELVKQKVITEEQARLSAQSNVITRALGVKHDVEVDVQELTYESGDRFLLCTDGVHGVMPEKDLVKIVTNTRISLGATLDDLITKVDSLGREKGGGHDNLTAAIITTKFNSILKEKMSRRIKNIILILSTVCLISIVANVWQVNNSSPKEQITNPNNYNKLCGDIITLKDSLSRFQEKDSLQSITITTLKDSLSIFHKKYSNNSSSSKQATNNRDKKVSRGAINNINK